MEKTYNTLLLSTAYLPPIEYFYYLNKFDNIIIEQHETWPKQTYRNRTIIVTDKGKQLLTVPVVRTKGNHTKTNKIKIHYDEKWHLKHWRAIESAYSNAPFFLYYADEIKEILFSCHKTILELNNKLLKTLCEMIGIDCVINFSDKFIKNPENNILDLRYKISPKIASTVGYYPEYIQVFSAKQNFISNASIIDLLFCLGPESKDYLDNF